MQTTETANTSRVKEKVFPIVKTLLMKSFVVALANCGINSVVNAERLGV